MVGAVARLRALDVPVAAASRAAREVPVRAVAEAGEHAAGEPVIRALILGGSAQVRAVARFRGFDEFVPASANAAGRIEVRAVAHARQSAARVALGRARLAVEVAAVACLRALDEVVAAPARARAEIIVRAVVEATDLATGEVGEVRAVHAGTAQIRAVTDLGSLAGVVPAGWSVGRGVFLDRVVHQDVVDGHVVDRDVFLHDVDLGTIVRQDVEIRTGVTWHREVSERRATHPQARSQHQSEPPRSSSHDDLLKSFGRAGNYPKRHSRQSANYQHALRFRTG